MKRCPLPLKYIFVIVGMLVGAGLLANAFLNLPDLEAYKAYGIWFILAYGLVMMLAGALGVPPVLFVLPASSIWDLPTAFCLCLAGGMGASVLGFVSARFGLQAKLFPLIPARILKFEHRLETHAFSTVLVMRLLFYLFPPINWMLGISHIRLSTFVGGTLLGIMPATFLYLWAGQGLWEFILGLDFWF